MARKNEKKTSQILLLGREKSFVIDLEKIKSNKGKFSCQYGCADLSKLSTKMSSETKSGSTVKIGKETFAVVSPSHTDLLRKCRRMPQVVLPKDAASVLSVTGVSSSSICADAGAGSGFLSMFLSPYVKKITTYEKNRQFAENVKKNIEFCGIENVVVKNEPVQKMSEKELDLITLDIPDAEKMVSRACKALKPGAWLCIYAPQIEQHMKCRERLQAGGRFVSVQTIENIQRSWKIDPRGFSHPHHSQVVHTGFLTFARKLK